METVGRPARAGERGAKWIAALTLSAALAAGGFNAQARAQPSPSPAVHNFDIPAQSLTNSLTRFGQQSGWQVSVNGDLIQGVSARGVRGTMTPEQALRGLVASTGFTYTISGGNTVTLQKLPHPSEAAPDAMQLPPVHVEALAHVPSTAVIDNLPPAYAGGQLATGGQLGLLGNRNFMDTPFSQTSYTNKTIQDQQARTVQDVLLNDPSILTKQNSASDEDGSITIRGFRAPCHPLSVL